MSILPAAPGRLPLAPTTAPLGVGRLALPLPLGAGAMGRGRMARSFVPPAEVDDAGDDFDETDATDRGEGPLADGEGVLVEMVTFVEEERGGKEG